jgi:hypothetical protein
VVNYLNECSTTGFPIPDSFFFKHKTAIPKKKKQFYSCPPTPFLVFFPSPSLPQSYLEMVRLWSFFYSESFCTFPCFFVPYSIILHCFRPATYIGPFPFFLPLFVPVQYLLSFFFDPFHQSLPLCIFHLVFGFFPIRPLLFLISCSSFSYSPVEVSSQECTVFPVSFHCVFDTSSCCLHLFTVYCHYFPRFITHMNFSFHASFFFSLLVVAFL